MAQELSIAVNSFLVPRDARRVGRAISRTQSGGLVRQNGVDTELDVALAKIDAVTCAHGNALSAVAKVTQAEVALAQAVPAASGRLAYLAERHALVLGDVLGDLERQLRRQ